MSGGGVDSGHHLNSNSPTLKGGEQWESLMLQLQDVDLHAHSPFLGFVMFVKYLTSVHDFPIPKKRSNVLLLSKNNVLFLNRSNVLVLSKS